MSTGTSGFNERIKLLIVAAGSQRKLAEIFGVSPPTITGWAGGSEPFESTYQRIGDRTGLSVQWLMHGKGDEDQEIEKIRRKAGRQLPSGARGALRAAREKAGLSYSELAKRTGRRVDYLRALEEGVAPISEATAEAITAAIPGLAIDELTEGSDSPRIVGDGPTGTYGAKSELRLPPGMKGRYVPLLSKAEAGTWSPDHSDAGYEYTGVFALNVDDRRAFAIKVSGNSMEPELSEGDMVICSPSQQPHNGEAVVVRTKGENVYIKYWHKKGDRVLLESANPLHKAIEYPFAEIAGAWPIVQKISAGKIIKKL